MSQPHEHTHPENISMPAPTKADHPSAPDMDEALRVLRTYWGYPAFRSIQADIIGSILSGNDTLGLMPTGGGKSITFQVPALMRPGLCLVITPLIALMKDQVAHLLERDIRACAIYTGLTREQIVTRLDNAIHGAYKFLYISPERLATSLFLLKVRRMKICMITVDEAHCISQWGYDFRPHYLRIAEIRKHLPGVPFLALTATATPAVIGDIQDKLAFVCGRVFKMSFARPNLSYVVRYTEDKEAELIHILRSVPGAAIVYVYSRKATVRIAELLNDNGIKAGYYHAGLSSVEKDVKQLSWQRDDTRVMVATNAFGMGIDKPDVRLVVHLGPPDSLEAYYQEAGRGGRDGLPSYAVLLHDKTDAQDLRRHVTQAFPDREYVRKVYTDLASYFQVAEGEGEYRTFDFDIERFCRVFRHYPATLTGALQLLTRCGYIHFSPEDENSSRVMFLITREQFYGINYLSNLEDNVLQTLMRGQGGFFADYVNIREDDIAEKCSVTRQEVYDSLCNLTRLRILHYIPHKDIPQVTYTQRRVDTQYVEIPYEVYTVRRRMMTERIEAMVRYFSGKDLCRSRYLLHYFDDEGPDCGHCDVCLDRIRSIRNLPAAEQTAAARHYIETTLRPGRTYTLNLFDHAGFPDEVLQKAVSELIDEGSLDCDAYGRITRK